MKKIILAIITASMILLNFTSCSQNKSDDDTLRVGIDLKFYPFMYMDENGNPAGLEPDLAKAFGEFIGAEVEIVNTDFSMLIPALDTGDIDIIISDMSVKPDRLEKVDFSKPYRYGRTLVLVNKEFATKNNVNSEMPEEDFFAIDGIKFAGLSGTIGATVPQSYGLEVAEFTEIASALMEVTKGRANALVGANTIWGDHAANAETTIVYDGISTGSESCFAVKKGNEELLEKANNFIDYIYSDGGFYEKAGTKHDEKIGEFLQNNELGLDYLIYPNGEE